MKKITVLILSVIMVFAIAAISLANSISLGYLVNGEDKINLDELDLRCDAKNIILSGNFDINDKFSVSGEFIDCDLKSGDIVEGIEFDNSSYKLKGSYAILQNEQVKLELVGGYLYRKLLLPNIDLGIYDITDSKIEGITLFVGSNVAFNLAKNMTIAAGFEYGLNPDCKISANGESNDFDLDSVFNYQVDFNYFITKQIGLSLGYRSSCWEVKNGYKDTISGMITGVTYKF
jgi:hypothetical protein